MEASWRSPLKPTKGIAICVWTVSPTAEKERMPHLNRHRYLWQAKMSSVKAVVPSGSMTAGIEISNWGRRGGTWQLRRAESHS